MSIGDQDLYVMMNVNGVAGSTKDPGVSSRLPILVTLDDLNPGQVSSVLTLPVYQPPRSGRCVEKRSELRLSLLTAGRVSEG